MKVLVTGGAGFIGSNFLYYMTDKFKTDVFTYNVNSVATSYSLGRDSFSILVFKRQNAESINLL